MTAPDDHLIMSFVEKSHSGFCDPWQLVVAAKSFDTMGRWVLDSSALAYEIRKRTVETKDGQSPLRYFDASTMLSYAFPTKASEIVFCRHRSDLLNCKRGHGFSPDKQSLPLSAMESRTVDGKIGVFASLDVPSSSYVALEKAVHGVYLSRGASKLLRVMTQNASAKAIRKVATFMSSYGHKQRRSVRIELLLNEM